MKKNFTSTIAKSDDGTIQITFRIPYSGIRKARESVLKKLAEGVEVKGFRRGKAPLSKVEEKLDQNSVLEKTLSLILPKLLSEAIEKYKIKPSMYPRFELIKAKPEEDWEIRAITCEIPEFELGDYKKIIKESLQTQKIWTPNSQKINQNTGHEPTREEKEQNVLRALLDCVKVKVPKVLIDEEVNLRLAKLLEKLEKLALSLESYLASTGKTTEDLKQEYQRMAYETIALELILNKVANQENLQVDSKEIDAAIEAAQVDPKLSLELNKTERRKFIESILRRRKALDFLVSLS